MNPKTLNREIKQNKMPMYENPLIIQSDRTLLLDVHAPRAEECRNALIPFAELVKSPEHLHTYQLTALSLWNAASANFTSEQAVQVLKEYARYEVPQNVIAWIKETSERFGKIRLVQGPILNETNQKERTEYLYLLCNSPFVFKEISANPALKKFLIPCEYDENVNKNSAFKIKITEDEKNFCFMIQLTDRGIIKQLSLIHI